MDPLNCGICLDQLRVPVCTPCGHLCCEACLTSYIEASADAINASCPTCRASFPIAIPDLRFVPKKYHNLIIPSIRRVFICTNNQGPGPSQSHRDLLVQIISLNEKVEGLIREKTLLMDRCEAAIRASHVHAQGERDERVEKERLTRELRELKKKYEGVKTRYKSLKAARENEPPQITRPFAMKRKSFQDSLDSISFASADGDSHIHSNTDDAAPGARPVLHIPKRPRLLGSPFDLSKRIETRKNKSQNRRLLDADEDGDASASAFLRESDLSSSVTAAAGSSSGSSGPQRSGLPAGDIFSPRAQVRGGGSGKVSTLRGGFGLGLGPGRMRPAWLLSPDADEELEFA